MDNLSDILKETKELHVLYVEDDHYVLKGTREILEKFFFSVDTAVDGEDGIDKYLNKKYDLIITDIRMPKKNGTGVGLYLAKKILDKIEAKISAKNTHQGLKMEMIFAKA